MTTERVQPEQADITTAVRVVLETLGVSLQDILSGKRDDDSVPTFAEYVPVVARATPKSSSDTWIIYWRVLAAEWGDRRIDEPTASQINELANTVKRRASLRPGARNGLGAMRNFIDAVKCLYRAAIDDQYITDARNPAAKLRKPPTIKGSRRALTTRQLAEINVIAASTGNDPELDSLILRLHTETACRRGGALALRPCDLDRKQLTIRLREKGDTVRDQPISATLMAAIIVHIEARNPDGADNDQLLRNRTGKPVHRSHYEALWRRLGQHLPWVKSLGVTAHWLRYTTLTWVERNFGYAVAAAYAGHTPGGRSGNTLTYVEATLEEVARALAALVGEPHPLADRLNAVDATVDDDVDRLVRPPDTDDVYVTPPLSSIQRRASGQGQISIDRKKYGLGAAHAGATVTVRVYNDLYVVELPGGKNRSFARSMGPPPVFSGHSPGASTVATSSPRNLPS